MSVTLPSNPATTAHAEATPAAPVRLSIVIEWANTRLHGVLRALRLFDLLERQWSRIVAGDVPADLAPEARRFLARLHGRAQLVIVSGEAPSPELPPELRARLDALFDISIHLALGLEYYPLKNFGAERATGDLLLFVDSDVLPEDGWLAQLVASFASPYVQAVAGLTYVAPTDVFATAFSLGWVYELRDTEAGLKRPYKVHGNNLMFRTEVFRKTGFRPLGHRTRGACSMLQDDLARMGVEIWENHLARVEHPPPTSVRHMIVRALAQGRDWYMKQSEERHAAGLAHCLKMSALRLGRGLFRTARSRAEVGLARKDVPAVLAIMTTYYAFTVAGGVLSHVHPPSMGRSFRV